MSFTNPLWNDILFEKIHEMHHAYMEMNKQIVTINMRLQTLEHRIVNISNVVSHMSSLFNTPQSAQQVTTIVPNINATNTIQVPIQKEVSSPPGLSKTIDEPIEERDDHEGEWTKVVRKRK
jgi:hypothetical protein